MTDHAGTQHPPAALLTLSRGRRERSGEAGPCPARYAKRVALMHGKANAPTLQSRHLTAAGGAMDGESRLGNLRNREIVSELAREKVPQRSLPRDGRHD